MGAFLASVLTLVLVSASVLIHYEVLRWTHRLIPYLALSIRTRILVVIGTILFAHLAEICVFALAYFIMHDRLGLGSIAGEVSGRWLDFFYFSASTYSTLGVGDVVPTGALRVVAGVESLTGLVLIGWSASYTYLTMQHSWDDSGGPATPA
jgi:hypothetical protein